MKANSLEQLTVHLSKEGFFIALNPEYSCHERLMEIVLGKMVPEQYFKLRRRRRVARYQDVLVKQYNFDSLADLFHSHRYAPRELECYHDYIKIFGTLEGFRLPKLLGYFEKKQYLLFHQTNGIMIEYIPEAKELSSKELMLAVPLFVHLYRRGIFHPDMTFRNVLYSPANNLLIPIDYSDCNFLPFPNYESLLIMLSWFLYTGKVEDDLGKVFVKAILKSLPELRLNLNKAWNCILKLKGIQNPSKYHHPIFLPSELRRQTQPDA